MSIGKTGGSILQQDTREADDHVALVVSPCKYLKVTFVESHREGKSPELTHRSLGGSSKESRKRGHTKSPRTSRPFCRSRMASISEETRNHELITIATFVVGFLSAEGWPAQRRRAADSTTIADLPRHHESRPRPIRLSADCPGTRSSGGQIALCALD